MDLAIPWYWFDATSSDIDEVTKESDKPADTGKGRKLRCLLCQYIITDESQRISIDGSHTQNKTNPGGIKFNFGCFQKAPGCSALGIATDEYTWFSGYKWQLAVCAGCGEHLGWLFRSVNGFYGLITALLVPDDDSTS